MRLNLYDILQSVLNESVTQGEVVDAINNRYRAFIDYSDEDNNAPGQRLVEPYALGITNAGNLALRAYQYQGATLSGIPKWKMFRLDRMRRWRPLRNSKFNLQPKDQGFDAPPYNSTGDKSMVSVLAQVKFKNGNDNLYQPSLDKMRRQTDQITNHSNALDLSKLEKTPTGPIRQRRNNVYTSRPTSKMYAQYRKNIADTQRDAEDTQKYWGDYDKAEQAREAQMEKLSDLDAIQGPIKREEDHDDIINRKD